MIRINKKDEPAYILWGVQHGFQVYDRINLSVDTSDNIEETCDELRNLFDLNIQEQRIFSLKQHGQALQLTAYMTISDGASRNGFYAIAVLIDRSSLVEGKEAYAYLLELLESFDHYYLTKDRNRLVLRTASPKLSPLLSHLRAKLQLKKRQEEFFYEKSKGDIACVYMDPKNLLSGFIDLAQQNTIEARLYFIPKSMKAKAFIPVKSEYEVTNAIEILNKKFDVQLLVQDNKGRPIEEAKVNIHFHDIEFNEVTNKDGYAIFGVGGFSTYDSMIKAIHKIAVTKTGYRTQAIDGFKKVINLNPDKNRKLKVKLNNQERIGTVSFTAFLSNVEEKDDSKIKLTPILDNKELQILLPENIFDPNSHFIELFVDNHKETGFKRKQGKIGPPLPFHSYTLELKYKQSFKKILLLVFAVGVLSAGIYFSFWFYEESLKTEMKDLNHDQNKTDNLSAPQKDINPDGKKSSRDQDSDKVQPDAKKQKANKVEKVEIEREAEPPPEPKKVPGEPTGLEREALISKIESSSDFNRGFRVPWQGDIEAYILAHPQDEEIKERWTLFKRYQNYVYHIRDIENKTGKEYEQIFKKLRGQEADLTSAQKAYIRNLKDEYYERASKKWYDIEFEID